MWSIRMSGPPMKIREKSQLSQYRWKYAKKYLNEVRLATFTQWPKCSREAVALVATVTHTDLCSLSNISSNN